MFTHALLTELYTRKGGLAGKGRCTDSKRTHGFVYVAEGSVSEEGAHQTLVTSFCR